MRLLLSSTLLLLLCACQPASEEPPEADIEPASEVPAAGAVPVAESRPAVTAELELPASFTGTLPCADCPGIAWHLDLWPDGVFHLERRYLERDGVDYDLGRWMEDASRDAILLGGAGEVSHKFSVEGPRTLRKLDAGGRPIESDLPYELSSDGTLEPVDLRVVVNGLFTYMADAPRFEVCRTGRAYPVAMEGAYIDLERAYLSADKPEPGAPLLARVEAEITDRPPMEGDRDIRTIVVHRFDGLFSTPECEQTMSEATLVNTYWKITELAGEPVRVLDNRREPHMILRADDEQRYSATVGCNLVNGRWDTENDGLRLHPGPTTMKACPPPLDELEKTLTGTLAATRDFEITGQTLELFDEAGERVAAMQAVHLR